MTQEWNLAHQPLPLSCHPEPGRISAGVRDLLSHSVLSFAFDFFMPFGIANSKISSRIQNRIPPENGGGSNGHSGRYPLSVRVSCDVSESGIQRQEVCFSESVLPPRSQEEKRSCSAAEGQTHTCGCVRVHWAGRDYLALGMLDLDNENIT